MGFGKKNSEISAVVECGQSCRCDGCCNLGRIGRAAVEWVKAAVWWSVGVWIRAAA